MTNRQVGGYEFKQECTTIRNSSAVINRAISRILDENVGQQTLYALLAKIAIENTNITNAVNTIEDIGANAKNNRT